MNKLTVKEFRETASLHQNCILIDTFTDEVLLKSLLGCDVGLDSLDIIDMVAEFEVRYNVLINSEAFDQAMYPAAVEATVEKFLQACNDCMIAR